MNIFTKYLDEKKNMNQPGENNRLAEVLKMFYVEARKEDGSAHSKSNLNSNRFGLNRHFLSAHDINIINDQAFHEANKFFSAKCGELKLITGIEFVWRLWFSWITKLFV